MMMLLTEGRIILIGLLGSSVDEAGVGMDCKRFYIQEGCNARAAREHAG